MIVAAVGVERDCLPAGIDGVVPSLQLQGEPAQQLLCLRIVAARRGGGLQQLERVIGMALLEIVDHSRAALGGESGQAEWHPQSDQQ
jgi:hypothetical protein